MMLSTIIFKRMSTMPMMRCYNNSFEWKDSKWSLTAVIQPPDIFLHEYTINLARHSAISFIICASSEKYQKGRTIQSYFIKMQDIIKLSLWKPTMPMLSFIQTNKIISLEKDGKDNTSKNILVSFYDRELPEDNKRKEMLIPTAKFQFFLDTLSAGIDEITYANQSRLSSIHEQMKILPPVSIPSRSRTK